uniref:Ras-related protein Rab-26 n=1 Tax=Glossina palpalis gambiensis TaxID=67801 RepID=A0A1B0B5K9_9MUSC
MSRMSSISSDDDDDESVACVYPKRTVTITTDDNDTTVDWSTPSITSTRYRAATDVVCIRNGRRMRLQHTQWTTYASAAYAMDVCVYHLRQRIKDDDKGNKVVLVDGTRVKLQIWDTAGQERFRSVTHAYYRDAHALLLLYDVTNKVTYDNIRAWLCEIRDCAQENVVIVLIGNKADCSNSDRQIKREDGERLAREHNVPFMETSAKTGQNVELAFETVARQLKSRGYENGDEGKFNVHEFVRDNTKAKSVCAQCNF